jgi:hypothetical protein
MMAKKENRRDSHQDSGPESHPESRPDNISPLYTTADEELLAELAELIGQRVAHVAVWEDSLADALDEGEHDPEEPQAFDIDLYLEEGVYFELYSVLAFDDPEGDPWQGMANVERRLRGLARAQAVLSDVAVDENDALVLVLQDEHQRTAYLMVAAWLLEEWEELPDE